MVARRSRLDAKVERCGRHTGGLVGSSAWCADRDTLSGLRAARKRTMRAERTPGPPRLHRPFPLTAASALAQMSTAPSLPTVACVDRSYGGGLAVLTPSTSTASVAGDARPLEAGPREGRHRLRRRIRPRQADRAARHPRPERSASQPVSALLTKLTFRSAQSPTTLTSASPRTA